MKKSILLISFILAQFFLQAQEPTTMTLADASRIALAAYIPNQVGGLTEEAKTVLINKLNQLSTKNGMGGSVNNQRFIITANVIELTKDITATTPTIYSYTLQVTIYIGDGMEGTKFSSQSITLKGSGKSETKAFIMALKEFDVNAPKYSAFIEEGKMKIIDYYERKCDFIIKEAQTNVSQNKFDEAIFRLISVPEVCKDCYNKCMDAVGPIYKNKIERECQQILAKSRTLKTQEMFDEAAEVLTPILPDLSCYKEAQVLLTEINDHRCAVSMGKAQGAWASKNIEETSKFLTEIPADSKCFSDAAKLVQEVKVWVNEKDKREWNFELQKYSDLTDIKKEAIKASRDIGVAYGNNQPKSITYNVKGWW